MQTLLLIVTLLVLIAMFVQNYIQLAADAEASPTELTFKEWLKHTWLEIILNFGCLTALFLGVDIGLADQLANLAGKGIDSNAFVGAIAVGVGTATAIRRLVQLTLLPLFGFILKTKTARAALRAKVEEAK